MRLGEPWALALLVLVPLVLVLHLVLERRRDRRIGAAGDASLIQALVLAEADGGKTIRLARAILLSVALLFAVLALARPQFGMRTEMRKGRGIDLVVALDLSKSMLARDVVPSRLDRARLEIEAMVKQLAGDRIGLVGFTSMALPLCPLTVDHSALRLQLRSANPSDFPRGGTAITEAITAAQQMLESSKKTGAAQAILLITDGEENEGDPAAAAAKAKEAGIEVHVAGVGSRTGEPIPLVKDDGTMDGYLKDAQGQTVISRLDEATLRKVADAGGGKLALPSDVGGLDLSAVRAHLATLKRAELEDRVVRVYEERYQWALVPAALALFAATLLRSTRRRARLVVRGLGASGLGALGVLLALTLAPGIARAEGSGLLESEDRDAREGNEHLQAGRAKEAVEAYGRAMKRLGEDPRLVLNRGLASSKAGELDAAVSDLRAAMENGTTPELRGQAAFALGNTYRQLKKWDDAITAYKRALVEDPKQRGARRNLEIAQRQKVIEASQPRDPNKKNDGDKPPPPNDQDGGVPDGGDGDGGGSPDAGPPPNDGGSSGDAGEDPASGDGGADGGGQGEPQGQDGGATGDSGGQGSEAPDAGGAADGGAAPQPEQTSPDQQDGKDEQDPSKDSAKQLLDSLQEQEKALKRKRLEQKLKQKHVEKDW